MKMILDPLLRTQFGISRAVLISYLDSICVVCPQDEEKDSDGVDALDAELNESKSTHGTKRKTLRSGRVKEVSESEEDDDDASDDDIDLIKKQLAHKAPSSMNGSLEIVDDDVDDEEEQVR